MPVRPIQAIPVLLRRSVQGYNLLRYLYGYYAVAEALGPMHLPDLTPEYTLELQQKGLLLRADTYGSLLTLLENAHLLVPLWRYRQAMEAGSVVKAVEALDAALEQGASSFLPRAAALHAQLMHGNVMAARQLLSGLVADGHAERPCVKSLAGLYAFLSHEQPSFHGCPALRMLLMGDFTAGTLRAAHTKLANWTVLHAPIPGSPSLWPGHLTLTRRFLETLQPKLDQWAPVVLGIPASALEASTPPAWLLRRLPGVKRVLVIQPDGSAQVIPAASVKNRIETVPYHASSHFPDAVPASLAALGGGSSEALLTLVHLMGELRQAQHAESWDLPPAFEVDTDVDLLEMLDFGPDLERFDVHGLTLGGTALPPPRTALISTIPRSGTWHLHYFFHLLHQLRSGEASPQYEGVSNGLLERYHQSLRLDLFYNCHCVCPGLPEYRFSDRIEGVPTGPLVINDFGSRMTDPLEAFFDPRCNPNARLVLVYRNPLDQAISILRHLEKHKRWENLEPEQAPAWMKATRPAEYLLEGGLDSYLRMYLSFLRMQEMRPEHVLLLRYEAIERDPRGAFTQLLTFFGIPLASAADRSALEKAIALSSRDRLKAWEAQQGRPLADDQRDISESHIRDGVVGRWRERYTDEEVEAIGKRLDTFGLGWAPFELE